MTTCQKLSWPQSEREFHKIYSVESIYIFPPYTCTPEDSVLPNDHREYWSCCFVINFTNTSQNSWCKNANPVQHVSCVFRQQKLKLRKTNYGFWITLLNQWIYPWVTAQAKSQEMLCMMFEMSLFEPYKFVQGKNVFPPIDSFKIRREIDSLFWGGRHSSFFFKCLMFFTFDTNHLPWNRKHVSKVRNYFLKKIMNRREAGGFWNQ